MRSTLIIGSRSPDRLREYLGALEHYGLRSIPVSDGSIGFQELSRYPHGFLLLECSMVWGKQEVPSPEIDEEKNWREIPLVLFANSSDATQPVDEIRIPILGVFSRFPSREEFSAAIADSDQAFNDLAAHEQPASVEVCHG